MFRTPVARGWIVAVLWCVPGLGGWFAPVLAAPANLIRNPSAEDGVLLVEWGDVVEALLPEGHLIVELTVPEPGDERSVRITAVGDAWRLRWERLERALDPWKVAG